MVDFPHPLTPNIAVSCFPEKSMPKLLIPLRWENFTLFNVCETTVVDISTPFGNYSYNSESLTFNPQLQNVFWHSPRKMNYVIVHQNLICKIVSFSLSDGLEHLYLDRE